MFRSGRRYLRESVVAVLAIVFSFGMLLVINGFPSLAFLLPVWPVFLIGGIFSEIHVLITSCAALFRCRADVVHKGSYVWALLVSFVVLGTLFGLFLAG